MNSSVSISLLPIRSRRHGFSMVELLTVVAIITVLGTLVGLGTGSKGGRQLESAGLTAANMLEFTRQNAMTRDAMSALVLTKGETPQMGIFELRTRADGAVLTGADWVQVGRWQSLPDGIVVDKQTFREGVEVATPAPPLPQLKGKTVAAADFSYAVFLPSGSLSNGLPASIRLAAGQSGAAHQLASDGDPANFFKLTVISATGRVKIDRR